ncbi:MAG: glycosyltransferase [Thermoleophilaceae bacterium]
MIGVRVCVVAEYYPRRRDPVLGVWAHRQALAAQAAGAEVRVLVLERPVPSASAFSAARRGDLRPVTRAARQFAAQPRHERLDGIEVEYVRFVSPPRERSYAAWERWAGPALGRALDRIESRWSPDLIHAHYALPAGGAALRWAAPRGLPVAVSVHGGDVLEGPLATPGARARVGGVLRSAAVVLCNSSGTRARAAELAGTGGGEQARMRVVHLGAEAPASPALRREAPTVVTLAHVIARKRHADVLEALSLLSERLPTLRWLVIGDGPALPALRARAARLGVADRVEWAGELPPERALEELAGCHVMALPSVREAFGLAYVEALACGVPAVGCRGEWGPEEIAALGGGMRLVAPEEPEALAAELEVLLSDPALLEREAVAARRTATEHFSWAECGRATVAAYEQALVSPS